MIPQRIQCSTSPGWVMPENTVYVGKATLWENPFIVGLHGDEAHCAKLYEISVLAAQSTIMGRYLIFSKLPEYVHQAWGADAYTPENELRVFSIARQLSYLKGKNLACWCPLDHPCHADALLRLVRNDFTPHDYRH